MKLLLDGPWERSGSSTSFVERHRSGDSCTTSLLAVLQVCVCVYWRGRWLSAGINGIHIHFLKEGTNHSSAGHAGVCDLSQLLFHKKQTNEAPLATARLGGFTSAAF